MKELIKQNEIKCEEIRKNIEQCENEILRFVNVLRSHVNILALHDICSIKECLEIEKTDPILRKESMYKRVTKSESLGYKVNTRVDTTEYQVIWAFDLTGKTIDSHTFYDFDKQWIENVLYFVYEQREYTDDHEADRGRYFSIFVAGMEYHECGTYEPHHQKLAFNNENRELTSILNAKVAVKAIELINHAIHEYTLFEKVKKELSKETA